MTSTFSVGALLAQGARQNQQEVCVSGWIWDRFEHRAIYDSLTTAPDPKIGICVTGQLPNRPTGRGDGPLHGQWVQLTGVFHWQPKRGAGRSGLWPAWLGVKSVGHTNTIHASGGSER